MSFRSTSLPLQELDRAVDMDVDLPARLGFPMLPRVPIRRLTDDAQQQDGHSIVNLNASSQQRLPRLVLVVDTNVLICSVARRVVATIGKLLRPVSKQASESGRMLLSLLVPRKAQSTTCSQGFCTLCCLAQLDVEPNTLSLGSLLPKLTDSHRYLYILHQGFFCDKHSIHCE